MNSNDVYYASSTNCRCGSLTVSADLADMVMSDIVNERLNGIIDTTKKEYDKMHKSPTNLPKTTGIIQRGRATIVTWDDGTKTTIVAEEGEEVLDMFHAFCIAFTKKMLGSTTNILKTIEANDTDAKKKAEDEMIKKRKEERRKFMKEMEKASFEKAVQEKLFDERVREEAIRRISERDFMAKKV